MQDFSQESKNFARLYVGDEIKEDAADDSQFKGQV